MVTIDDQTNSQLINNNNNNNNNFDDDIFETNSDSDNDSALMEDAHSVEISSSITTNGSSSLNKDQIELHRFYRQGYRDIGLTFLLVLGADLCLPLIDTITKSHFNCLAYKFSSDLSTKSITIVFHSESISTLPKTLTSIILRNAIKYIHEIITLFLCIEGWNSSFPAA
ncbi:unnamed protein product [Rotaria socialis]|uniref:Uncharacterized protein n=1 Tax=Rotaria socialis TaxID=392032 RepID=A0A817WQ10_9BILA|nr:unnamed protein product [Rotaria socialis]